MHTQKPEKQSDSASEEFSWMSRMVQSPLQLLILFGLLVSMLIYFSLKHLEKVKIDGEFVTITENNFNSLDKEIKVFLADLQSLQQLFIVMPDVSRADFKHFTTSILERHKGFQAISWNRYLTQEQLSDFHKQAKAEVANFQLYEHNEKGAKVELKERPSHVIVYYIEPFEPNKVALGYDLSSNPQRQRGIKRAQETKNVVATQRIKLVQEQVEMFGVLLLMPVFAKSNEDELTGFVVGVIRIVDLASNALGDNGHRDQILTYFFDMDAPTHESLLYSTGPSDITDMEQLTAYTDAHDLLMLNKSFLIGERRWEVAYQATPEFVTSRQTWLPMMALLTTLLLFLSIIYLFKKKEQLKNEFISLISHELRTPLTSIKGSIDLLIGLANMPQNKTKSLLDIINSNCNRLIALVSNILDLDKIEAGKMSYKLEKINVADLLNEALKLNEGYASKFNVQLVLNGAVDEDYIYADEGRIIQVLTNLISNGVKYSKEHGVVELSSASVDGLVRISVKDHGKGIPQA
jgi:signal transduction histidine kinase